MSWPQALAALLAAGAAVFHTSVAGRVLGPLAASDLPTSTRWLADLCWHGIGLTFVVMAAAFVAGAVGALSSDAMRLMGVLAAAIAILCGVGAVRAGLAPWRHPATYVLGLAATLAFMGG